MEGFIKFVKKELTTMRHDPAFLATILKKLLRTHCIDSINSSNSYGNKKAYARRFHVRALSMKQNVATALEDSLALSGVVDKDGNVYLCAKASVTDGGGYKLFNVKFDDSKCEMVYNLHYARATIAPCGPHRRISDAFQLSRFATDYVLMVRREDKWTVLSRNWKVRKSSGQFELLKATLDNFTWAFKTS